MLLKKAVSICRAMLMGWVVVALASPASALPGKDSRSKDPMPPAQVVDVREQKIQYYEAGQGDVVIFLHGLGSNSQDWVQNLGPVAKKHRAIAIDQIGFGHSSKPLLDYSIATFSEYLLGFMQALNIPRASLVGNSLGGWVAADFAIRHPEMVDQLVLVDAAGLKPDLDVPILPQGLNPGTLLGARRVWKFLEANKRWTTEDLSLDAFERHMNIGDHLTIAAVLVNMLIGGEFLDSKLGSVQAPTLLIWGQGDILIPAAYAERYEKGITNAKLVTIKNASHLPMMQKPRDVNKALLKFLDH